jgi:hypothetical protein
VAKLFGQLLSYAASKSAFWFDWGPIFYRGRLNKSALPIPRFNLSKSQRSHIQFELDAAIADAGLTARSISHRVTIWIIAIGATLQGTSFRRK